MEHRDELDEVLDRALSGYAEAEPLAGLEQRVLQRTRAISDHRRQLYRRWALALCWSVLPVLVLLEGSVRMFESGSNGSRTQRVPVRKQTAQATATQEPPVFEIHTVAKPHVRAKAKLRPQPRLIPKLDQFPTSSPLTAEERVLVAFVRQYPKDAATVFDDLSKRANTPIAIQPIQIQPLENDTTR